MMRKIIKIKVRPHLRRQRTRRGIRKSIVRGHKRTIKQIGEGMQVKVYRIPKCDYVIKEPKTKNEIKRSVKSLDKKNFKIMFGNLSEREVVESMFRKRKNLDKYLHLGVEEGFAKIEKIGGVYLHKDFIPGDQYIQGKSQQDIKTFFVNSIKINRKLEKIGLKNTFNPLKDYGVDKKGNVKLFDFGEIRPSKDPMKKEDYFKTESAKLLKEKNLKIYRDAINETID